MSSLVKFAEIVDEPRAHGDGHSAIHYFGAD
jgi:hypothetical protein